MNNKQQVAKLALEETIALLNINGFSSEEISNLTKPIEDFVLRRSGKTTRTIDQAIQALFKYGIIYVPLNTEKLHGILAIGDFGPEQIIIDQDAHISNRVQEHLLNSIFRRLQIEHQDQFRVTEVELIVRKDYNGKIRKPRFN